MQPLKDSDTEKYYQECFATMATPGWKLLMEDVARAHDVKNNVDVINNERELHTARGFRDALNWVLTMQVIWESVYASLQRDEQDADLD